MIITKERNLVEKTPPKVGEVPFMELIPVLYKNVSKLQNLKMREENLMLAFSEYYKYHNHTIDLDNSYKNLINTILPFSFVANNNVYLFINGKYMPLDYNNLSKIFKFLNLNMSKSLCLEKEIIKHLTQYIKAHPDRKCKSIAQISTYNIKYNNGNNSFLNSPLFFEYNKTLYVFNSKEDISSNKFLCISEKNSKDLFKNYNLKYGSKLMVSKSFSNIRNYISPVFETKKAENPLYINIILEKQNKLLTIIYNFKEDIFYFNRNEITSYNNYRYFRYIPPNFRIENIPAYYNYCKGIISMEEKSLSCNKESLLMLWTLCNGNIEILKIWSLLFASIASPELLIEKIFCFSSNLDPLDLSIHFDIILEILFSEFDLTNKKEQKRISTGIFNNDINKTIKKDIYELCNEVFTFTKCIYTKAPSFKNNDEIKRFKKLISGKRITCKDNIVGNINFINSFPILCLCKNHIEYESIQKVLPTLHIDISFLDNTFFYNFALFLIKNPNLSEWLRINLTLYGLTQIYSKPIKINRSNKVNNIKLPYDDIMTNFITSCCNINLKENVFTYADKLYLTYKDFYISKYGGNPLSQRKFVSTLKLNSSFPYKRPHVSRNQPNKYAFMNLTVKEGWNKNFEFEKENVYKTIDDDCINNKAVSSEKPIKISSEFSELVGEISKLSIENIVNNSLM